MKTLRILILDDDILFADLVARVLRVNGDPVSVCSTWNTAEELIVEHGINVFWADLRIPPGGITESIERLGIICARFPDLIVVVSSGHLLDGVRERLEAAGVKYAMEKSSGFDPVEAASLVLFGVYKSGKANHAELLASATAILQKVSPHSTFKWPTPPKSGKEST